MFRREGQTTEKLCEAINQVFGNCLVVISSLSVLSASENFLLTISDLFRIVIRGLVFLIRDSFSTYLHQLHALKSNEEFVKISVKLFFNSEFQNQQNL